MNTRTDRIDDMAMHRGFAQPHRMWCPPADTPDLERRHEPPRHEIPLVNR